MESKMKIVCIGDGGVGKTCLLSTWDLNLFPVGDYTPTIYNTIEKEVIIDNMKVELEVVDTIGCEEYRDIRHALYPGTDLFIICYSVNSRISFERVGLYWINEIIYTSPGTSYIIVGTKIDLRDDKNVLEDILTSGSSIVSFDEGETFARTTQARGYYECSSKTCKGINSLFEECIRIVLSSRNSKNSKNCSII